jgi:hypothetical protein
MVTSLTLVSCLVVGIVGVRVLKSDNVEISIDSSYVLLLENSSQKSSELVRIAAPEMSFEEIKIPVEVKRVSPRIVAARRSATVSAPELKIIVLPKNELPFHEPVKLARVEYRGELLEEMVALYDGLPVEEKVLVAEAKKLDIHDEVKTAQSSEKEVTDDAEPEFFEYEDKADQIATPTEVAGAANPINENTIENVEISVQDMVPAQTPVQAQAPTPSITNLVGFDYSALRQDLQDKKVPTVSAVTTRQRKSNKPKVDPVPTSVPEPEEEERTNKSLSQMTIQGVATDLKTNGPLVGFELRFQDNTSEAVEDYGDGEVTVSVAMAHQKMIRSTVILKRGFVPTNTDLIFEEGAGSVSIPVLPQDLFDDLMLPFENNGQIGSLLVKLDDSTEIAKLDVPFGKVITLDGNMRETTSEDFRYQLFVGVKAGNAILSYTHGNEVTHKIIHIHERELSYESNYFEKTNINQVSLYQEDLLSREKSPLVTSSENVKVFAKNIHGEKLNQNTYRINFGKALLGARNYLELGHEKELLFVGTKDETTISIPSESFIRHVLGSLPESQLGNRCAIQVNIKKKISDVVVGSESVGESLMVNPQYLDTDGKFYDSASEKTRKVVVFGENQGADAQDMNGKVNLKITYLDGTVDFLGTYCSPNTYLVEQL